jgi:hypothetical protein
MTERQVAEAIIEYLLPGFKEPNNGNGATGHVTKLLSAYGASERAAGEIAGLETAHELIDHLGSRGLVAAEIARRRAEQGEQTDATA